MRKIGLDNEEVAAGTGMSPNEYMERFVQDGKQAVAREVDGDDTERTAKAERELERQKELTVGTRVRLVSTATQKSELRGARKTVLLLGIKALQGCAPGVEQHLLVARTQADLSMSWFDNNE